MALGWFTFAGLVWIVWFGCFVLICWWRHFVGCWLLGLVGLLFCSGGWVACVVFGCLWLTFRFAGFVWFGEFAPLVRLWI